ncbi:hypothetical protein MMC07_001611 [Pseudocyphellaria aurata]|nr:hypothetical protein [Pseudocyphellaria aurata]
MGGTAVAAFESRPQRLSKARTNSSSPNLLKITVQHYEPSSPISPADTHVFGDDNTPTASPFGKNQKRRRSRSKFRSCLYGAGQDNSQSCSSGDEEQDQKGLVDIARGVKGRLSRAGTATSISQLRSAGTSSTQLSNASSSKLLLINENRPSLEESARIAREIKEKAYADSLAAQNHVAPPVDEDLHVDSVKSPIRRRSLYTPGIATRNPNDILRKPPPPETLHSRADRDYYFNQNLPKSSPLGQLAALEIGEGGRSTPSNLDYSHLGGLKLGTLRVTNGTASPAPGDINPLGMHPTKPRSIDHDEFFTASEGGESLKDSYYSETYHPSRDFQAQSNQQTSGVNTTGRCHDDSMTRAQNSGSPLKHEHRPEERLEVECLSRYNSRASQRSSFLAHPNVSTKSSNRALYNAQDYIQDIPDSPYSYVESCNGSANLEHLALGEAADQEFSEDEGLVGSRSQLPTVNVWRSFIDAAEARHANDGTREDALRKLTANATSPSESAVRPVSSSTVSRNTDLSEIYSESMAAKTRNNADSGYSSGDSAQSIDRLALGGSAGESIEEHSMSRPRSPRCVSGTRYVHQAVQDGANNKVLRPTTKQDQARPPMLIIPSVEKEPPVLITKPEAINPPAVMSRPKSMIFRGLAEARKLRKTRPVSQPNSADLVTVQCIRDLTSSNIPPVPIDTVVKHIERLTKFPLLEHTFPSLQHVRSNESLYAEEPIIEPVRFPSPSNKLQREVSIIRSDLDWPSSRSKKSTKSKSILRRSFTKKAKTERRTSQSEDLAEIADLGTVAASLGCNPYDIARSTTVSSRNASSDDILKPHHTCTSPARPRTMIGMDEEFAAEFARARSRHKNKGSSGLYVTSPGGFNDRGGIPGKLMRPQGLLVDAPPVPALPAKEELYRRSRSVSKPINSAHAATDNRRGALGKLNRAHSMYVDVPPVPLLPTKQQVARWEAQISNSNSTRPSILPPPLQIKTPKSPTENPKTNGVAKSNTEKPEKSANPVGDWKEFREGWNQRRKSAGEALLLRFQELSNSKTPIVPCPSSSHTGPSDYTPYTRPSSPVTPCPTESLQNTRPPLQSLPQSPAGITSSSQSFNIPRKKVATGTTTAFEPLTGRYVGGLSYAYEPGLGLGGSAGTRSATTGASRKSVDMSRGYGIDLSDIPIFVPPS